MENKNFIVSARKYRPTTFSSVVGQKNLTATLQNAIATDRLAHSYLFCGSRGVGKTSCARIFAKTINCQHRTPDGNPCNECDSCKAFNEGRSFNIIELDAASNNGVDDMRKITEQVMVPPTDGRYRVFIIDEVHMLSAAAFNAFLKTLEEPPSYIIFILATTEKQKIIPTILSRCQIYDFNRITVADITDHLAMVAQSEGITADRQALAVIATQADGALRDALSIFDQIVASSRGNVTYQSVIENLNILDNSYFENLMEAFGNSDVASALLILKEIREKGFNIQFFINGLQTYVRNLMMARDPRTLVLLDTDDEEKKRMQELAAKFTPDFYFMALSLINDADLKYRDASNKTFLAELLLIKLCQLLSPSPVFRGKEEGHIDSQQPLGAQPQAAAPAAKAPAHALQADSQTREEPKAAPASPTPAPSQSAATEQPARQRPKAASPMLKVGSIKGAPTLTEKLETAVQPEADKLATNHPEAHKLTQEAVKEAWLAYADSIPLKKMFVNLMRSVDPLWSPDKPLTVSLLLANDLQKDLVETEWNDVKAFMEKKLSANGLQLSIELSKSDKPQLWTEKQALEHMLQAHPDMKKFIQDLGLTLS